jgi:hypothetical protein
MSIRAYSDPLMNSIGILLFPELDRAVRRRNLRFLFVSVLIGMIFCLAFGGILLILNHQGRI